MSLAHLHADLSPSNAPLTNNPPPQRPTPPHTRTPPPPPPNATHQTQQGKAWQFKGWPFAGADRGDAVELFSKVLGVYLHYADEAVPPAVRAWNVRQIALQREARHLDRCARAAGPAAGVPRRAGRFRFLLPTLLCARLLCSWRPVASQHPRWQRNDGRHRNAAKQTNDQTNTQTQQTPTPSPITNKNENSAAMLDVWKALDAFLAARRCELNY